MARRESAPAFQAYAADLLSDNTGLSNEEFGVFMRLAMVAWREGGLPGDPSQLGRRAGMRPHEFQKMWPGLESSFERRGDQLVIPWMEDQRAAQATRREVRARNGSLGGRPRKQPVDENPTESYRKPLGCFGETQTAARESSATTSSSASSPAFASSSSAKSESARSSLPATAATPAVPAIASLASRPTSATLDATQALASIGQLPSEVRQFAEKYFGEADPDRLTTLAAELHATLNGGVMYRGNLVKAGSRERLARKASEVLRQGVRKKGAAMAVLLAKLGDWSEDSPTEKAAAEGAQLVVEDRRALAKRKAISDRFKVEHPEEAARIVKQFDEAHPSWQQVELLRDTREAALISALAAAAGE